MKKFVLSIVGVAVVIASCYYVNIEFKYREIVNKYNENYVVEDMNEIDKIHAAREFVYTNSVFANGEDVLLNGFSQEIFD